MSVYIYIIYICLYTYILYIYIRIGCMGKHHSVAQVLQKLGSTNGYTYPCAVLDAKRYLLQVNPGPFQTHVRQPFN